MSFIGRLFATPESINKTVSAAIAAGDKLVFTEEEKADMNLKMRDWYLEYLKATQPMNLSRRFIAMIVTSVWAIYLGIGTVTYLLNKYEMSTFIFNVMKDNINIPFGIIVGFYFAAHALKRYKD